MSEIRSFFGQTLPGFEQIAWLELKKLRPTPKLNGYAFAKDQNGIVLFEAAATHETLLDLRTFEDVFLTVLYEKEMSRNWGDLRLIARQITEAESFDAALRQFRTWYALGNRVTYRVVARKFGQHAFRRKDLKSALESGMYARYGVLYEQVEEDADIEIWINMLGSDLLCGLRLSDRTMRHRSYQLGHVEAVLRPSAAAAMVLLSQPTPDDVFVDPMCGSGTILFERALAESSQKILGGDIDLERLSLCERNLAQFPQRERVQCGYWDARKLPLEDASVDKIVTNPPFGKQISDPRAVQALYPGVFREMDRVLKPGGRLVVISSEYDLIKQVLRKQPALALQTGYSVALLGQWARIYIIDKKA